MFAFEKQNLWSKQTQELNKFVWFEMPQSQQVKQELQNTQEGKDDADDVKSMKNDSQSVESRLQQLEQLRTERFKGIDKNSNGADTQVIKAKVDALILQSILKTPEAKTFSVLPASQLESFDTNALPGLNTLEFRAYLENLGKVIDMVLLANLDKNGKTNNLVNLHDYPENQRQQVLAIITAAPELMEYGLVGTSNKIPLEELQNRADVLVQINRDLKSYKGDRTMLEATKQALLKKDFNPQDTYDQIDGYTLETTKISYAEIIAKLINDSRSVVDRFQKKGESEPIKMNERSTRLQTLLESFEQKHPDEQYKPALLEAHALLQQNKFDEAAKLVQKFVVQDITSTAFGNMFTSEQAQIRALTDATMSDLGLAQALRTMKDTKKAGEQFRSVIGSREVEEGKSLDKVVEGLAKTNLEQYRGLAEQRFNQMLQAAQGRPELTELTNNREEKIVKLQTVLATVGEFDKYMKANADSMQGIAKEYIDMKGLGGSFDFTDENASLTQTLLIEAALLILLAPTASLRIASKIPGLMKKARDAARSGKYVKQVEEVNAVQLEAPRDVARAAFSPEGTGAHNIRRGAEVPRPNIVQVERSAEFKAVGERVSVTQKIERGGVKEVKVDGKTLEEGELFLDKNGNIIRFEKTNGDRLQFQTLDKATGQPKGDPSYFKVGELNNKIQRVKQVAKAETVPARVVDPRPEVKVGVSTENARMLRNLDDFIPGKEYVTQEGNVYIRQSDGKWITKSQSGEATNILNSKSVDSMARQGKLIEKEKPAQSVVAQPRLSDAQQDADIEAMLKAVDDGQPSLIERQKMETLIRDNGLSRDNGMRSNPQMREVKPSSAARAIQEQNAAKGLRMEEGKGLVRIQPELESLGTDVAAGKPITKESVGVIQDVLKADPELRIITTESVNIFNTKEAVAQIAKAVNDRLPSLSDTAKLGALTGLIYFVYPNGPQQQEALAQLPFIIDSQDKKPVEISSESKDEKPVHQSGSEAATREFRKDDSPSSASIEDLIQSVSKAPTKETPVKKVPAQKPQTQPVWQVPVPERVVDSQPSAPDVTITNSQSEKEKAPLLDLNKALEGKTQAEQKDIIQDLFSEIFTEPDKKAFLASGEGIMEVRKEGEKTVVVLDWEGSGEGFGNVRMTIDANNNIALEGNALNYSKESDFTKKGVDVRGLLKPEVKDYALTSDQKEAIKVFQQGAKSSGKMEIPFGTQQEISGKLMLARNMFTTYKKLADKFGYLD